jgi:hypothetical protein
MSFIGVVAACQDIPVVRLCCFAAGSRKIGPGF